MFWPKPPNKCLPTRIANTPPKQAAHQGRLGGRAKAKSMPVSTALESFIVEGLLRILKITSSVITAEIIQDVRIINARVLNIMIEAATAGTRAIITCRII